MKRYSGIFVTEGTVRRLTYEAADDAEAVHLAAKWGIGMNGEAPPENPTHVPVPVAFDLTTARQLLGNISRATAYRWLAVGRLERVADTGKILITRKSIEAFGAKT